MSHVFLSATEQNKVKKIIVAAGKRILATQEHTILAPKGFASITSDIVTQTDINTENFLREQLVGQFPQIGFFSEETYKTSYSELEKELVWVVDPIDGTFNFSRGLPLYGISVALLHQMRPVFGLVYFPALEELYSAYQGSGAFVGERQLHMPEKNDLTRTFGIFAGTGFSIDKELEAMRALKERYVKIVDVHTAVFELCHVADGAYDFCAFINTSLWDLSAGQVIIEEAGGKVVILKEDLERKKAQNPYHIWAVGGSPKIVDQLVTLIKEL